MEEKYKNIAKESRLKCLELVYKAQTSHIGSLFSCADIMAVLFEKIDLDKDKFVLSAGWKAAMLYFHLWKKGRITEEELNSYCQEGSKFIGLAEPIVPEIQIAGGSMGLGFPGAVGLALAKKLKKEEGRVYCLISDGEMQIGTFWESLLIAGQHKLDNLTLLTDINGLQAMGKTEDILNIPFLDDTFRNAGWEVSTANGHFYPHLENSLKDFRPGTYGDYHQTKPKIIISHTIKGKGVPFMENNNLYHYKQLSETEFNEATEWLNKDGGNN